MIRSFLASLEPDQHALFFAIARHIDDGMLDVIACADYYSNADQHLVALKHLRDTGELAEPFHWYPCEVLELTRNSDFESSTWRPTVAGAHGNWMRAFASAALLRASGPPWNYETAAEPSFDLIQLLRSLPVLPVNLSPQAIQFVAWLLLQTDLEGPDEQNIYFGIGLLWLTLRQANPPADEHLIRLSEWIVRREEELRHKRPGAFDRWLLGIARDPPPSRWERLGEDLTRLNLRAHRLQLQEWVKLIGTELSGQEAE
jgi:hypothetical protein